MGRIPGRNAKAECYDSCRHHGKNPWRGCQSGILTYQSLSQAIQFKHFRFSLVAGLRRKIKFCYRFIKVKVNV